jgi:hypothetical protein
MFLWNVGMHLLVIDAACSCETLERICQRIWWLMQHVPVKRWNAPVSIYGDWCSMFLWNVPLSIYGDWCSMFLWNVATHLPVYVVIDAACSFETLMRTCQSIRRHVPKYHNMENADTLVFKQALCIEAVFISYICTSHFLMGHQAVESAVCKWGYYYYYCYYSLTVDRGGTVVKVLCYKSEGRWFDSRWCHGIFHGHNPSDRTMALGSTQPLTEMNTRIISWG